MSFYNSKTRGNNNGISACVDIAKSDDGCKKKSKSVSSETLVGETATTGRAKKQNQSLSERTAETPLYKVMESSLHKSLVFGFVKLLIIAMLLSTGIMNESLATTGCVKDGSYVKCYNASGKQIFSRLFSNDYFTCSGNSCSTNTGDTINYNPSTNKISSRRCSSHTSGVCINYNTYNNEDYSYDEQGNEISHRHCVGSEIDSSGNCTIYSSGTDYTYDQTTGKRMSSRYCNSVNTDGSCNGYYSGSDYIYDQTTGKQTSSRGCNSVNTDGSCNGYSSGSDYTYDPTTGNLTSSRGCNSVNTDGSCNGYSGGMEYTYDPTTGKQTSYKECDNYSSSGECLGYVYATNTTYDENGKEKSYKGCYYETINTSQGECISYSFGTDYIYDGNGKLIKYTTYCDSNSGDCTIYTETCTSSINCSQTDVHYGSFTDGTVCSGTYCFNTVNNCFQRDNHGVCTTCTNNYLAQDGDCVTSCNADYFIKERSCVDNCGKGYVGNSSSGNCALIIDDETTELNLEIVDSDNLEIVCYSDIARCKKIAEKTSVSDRTYYNTPHMMDFSDKVIPATEDLCVGKYLWNDDSCNKMNEWECNASGEYYFDGTTCADRPEEGEIICNNPSYKAENGICWRKRYTPAEVAKVVGESNTILLYYK